MQNYPSTCNFQYINGCKIDEGLNIKICSCIKRLFGKLVLACEDEIINTTGTLFDDEKVTKKNNCLIHTTTLLIIFLLSLVYLSICCYYYYTKDWIKEEHAFL